MNERYLSRAKQTATGEWVTGYYTELPRPRISAALAEYLRRGQWSDIDPKTLGQCTGLRDRNETLIFDGDILRVHGRGSVVARVYWGGGSWMLLYDAAGDDEWLENCCHRAEIIGNIHDNPELIERTDNQ